MAGTAAVCFLLQFLLLKCPFISSYSISKILYLKTFIEDFWNIFFIYNLWKNHLKYKSIILTCCIFGCVDALNPGDDAVDNMLVLKLILSWEWWPVRVQLMFRWCNPNWQGWLLGIGREHLSKKKKLGFIFYTVCYSTLINRLTYRMNPPNSSCVTLGKFVDFPPDVVMNVKRSSNTFPDVWQVLNKVLCNESVLLTVHFIDIIYPYVIKHSLQTWFFMLVKIPLLAPTIIYIFPEFTGHSGSFSLF